MTEGSVPEPGLAATAEPVVASREHAIPPAVMERLLPDPKAAPKMADVGEAAGRNATGALDRIEEHLEAIDSRLRMLEDRFDDMVAELRTLGTDLANQANRQQHNATKEWITWAVVTILVVILGAMWWAFKIYILPGHHQVM